MQRLPQEIIARKRDGNTLDSAAIEEFVTGIVTGEVSDAHIAAFAMATYLNHMSSDEIVALTSAMAGSGHMLSWRGVCDGPVLDKHSTGGVGDKVSLVLAPLVAACGGYVPMISGRGLGHTGGTLDKLSAIPGYDTTPDEVAFRRTVTAAGCAIVGQSEALAPADRRMYAVRDVTATVESIPLIVASILSKKLAAGLDALVLDVKYGSGAFMKDTGSARMLATNLVEVATMAGLETAGVLTDMGQVLGRTAGNAVEVLESVDWLKGVSADRRFDEVVVALGVEMLLLGGLAVDADDATRQLASARASGAAAERFERMVHLLGGPVDLLDRPDRYLQTAPVIMPVYAPEGVVASIDVRAVGIAVVELGGGRRRVEDPVDTTVGLTDIAGIAEPVGSDRPIAVVHARSRADAEQAAHALLGAFTVNKDGLAAGRAPDTSPSVLDVSAVLERVTATEPRCATPERRQGDRTAK